MSSFISPYTPRQQTTATATDASPAPGSTTTPTATVNYVTSNHNSRNKFQITPAAASKGLQHMISSRFMQAGFTGSDPEAIEFMYQVLCNFILEIAGLSVDYATLANRSVPNVRDVVIACEKRGMTIESLRRAAKKTKKRDKNSSGNRALVIGNPPPQSKPPVLLPSDSEEESNDEAGQSKSQKKGPSKNAYQPPSLRSLPPHFPPFPPKHTYLRTQAPSATTTSLSSLQQKIDNAAIIQDSLRNLIQATEAPPAPRGLAEEDGVPPTQILPVPAGLGGLVNWEAAGGTRRVAKRWKI
ncbi:hypothetical protein FRC03_009795 [Tulasnella sp. 419]|nr:hypothetical protein FRC03_009795 [Tulasnella sp. 419]